MSKSARLLVALAFCLLLLTLGALLINRWIDSTVLPAQLAQTSVEVRGQHEVLLRAYQIGSGIWRLKPGKVDPNFVAMLLRYEDKRFWSHHGVDSVALLRALAQALWYGRPISGGSTLTMQVARLIEHGPTGRWSGKLRQIRVALALERRFSKQQILNLYLTTAPYGGNLEGIRAATMAWFGKQPRRLTPAQAALLVALPQSPELRRPDRHPQVARNARDRVLQRMAAQGVISVATAQAAITEVVPTTQHRFPKLAAHLADRVHAAHPGVLHQELTIDAGVQAQLEKLAHDAALKAGSQVSAAIVVADHQTGKIIASVGSAGYSARRQGYVDMTSAVRSPGSTLKPLIYGLAFDQGLARPETLISDTAVIFGRYAPHNFDGKFRGDVRVSKALQMSLNIPAVRLTNALGPNRVMAALRRAGADPHLPGGKPGLAIALGGVGLTLDELVQIYAGLAEGGQGPILHYEQDAAYQQTPRLISAVAAWQVGHILIGLPPPANAPAQRVAYKTGTSYGHRDAWAVGYDGRDVIGVWMGRADGTPVPGAFGGGLAAPLLFDAFAHVEATFEPLAPPPAHARIASTAELPLPLRRFRPRLAAFDEKASVPQLLFPPDGARLEIAGGPLTIKLRGGKPPFAVLADGKPVASGIHRRSFEIPNLGHGYATVVVVDNAGHSARVSVQLD